MSNRRSITLIFSLIITVLLTSACHRQVTSHYTKSELSFTAPWSQVGFQETHAQVWQTVDSLYFAYQVIDTSLVSIIANNFHHGIGNSDRVEVFFSTDTLLTHYYGMEIGYDNRVLSFHGQPNKKIDYHWSWPKESVNTVCTVDSLGYTCQIQIAISYLNSLNLVSNNQIQIGVFRADYHKVNNPKDVTWITTQRPTTQSPDFHTPSAFFLYQF